MPLQTILVPTDFSTHADRALEQAIELARSFGARIHLLHSCAIAALDPYGLPHELVARIDAGARRELAAREAQLVRAGIQASSSVSGSVAASAIFELASSLPADLVVMGTLGRTGLKHVLLGSVAERTVRLAPCPVLIVKESPPERAARGAEANSS
jgi:universal stress protein A